MSQESKDNQDDPQVAESEAADGKEAAQDADVKTASSDEEASDDDSSDNPSDDASDDRVEAASVAAADEMMTAEPDQLEPPVVGIIRRIDNTLGYAEQALLCVFLLVLISIGVIQAVSVKFGTGLGPWSFGALRYSVFFIAMTGAALSAHTGQLIAMDFVTRMLSRAARVRLQMLLRAFTVGISFLLVKGGLLVTESVAGAEKTGDGLLGFLHSVFGGDPSIGLLALPIGAGLIGLHVLMHLIIDVVYVAGGRLPPETSDPERSVH